MKVTTRLKAAGDLLFGSAKSALKSILLDPSNYRGDQFTNGMWYFGPDGVDKFFSYTDDKSSLNAYNQCPPLSAIINRKAQSYVNGKTWILENEGENTGKVSTKKEALKVNKLLMQPNKLQSGKQFESQWVSYKQIYGYAIILFDKPMGFPNRDAKSMWVIPNWMCTVYESKTIFYKEGTKIIDRIEINYKGTKVDLPLDSVGIIKDLRISFESVYLPDSRIKTLEMPINNIIGAYESRNVLINKRGPNYLVSNTAKDQVGTLPITPEQKEEAKQAFAKYGLRKNQSQAIFTTASLSVSALGFDVSQLRLMEEVTESAKSLCDAYGYPPHLLGLIDPTFNNQNAAEKGLYQNTLIPEAESDTEQWNAIFKMEDIGCLISKDFGHISVLQEDQQQKALARQTMGNALNLEFKNNWIKLNRVLELLGEDTLGKEGDLFYYELVSAGRAVAVAQNIANGINE